MIDLAAAPCPHCGATIFRKSSGGNRFKARTGIVVIHRDGALELNCGACRQPVILPTKLPQDNIALRKAVFVARQKL
jgi:hypothetical protein